MALVITGCKGPSLLICLGGNVIITYTKLPSVGSLPVSYLLLLKVVLTLGIQLTYLCQRLM